ncbi:biotin--[acetyl-CoA-carboxylase] ligase [Bacillus canaveralius]|uniref:Bifunctional ligase/repressor BirA n=1 Tax=Bacillus canaveralius TaxID=1403243 RepID=A0A2N5GI02_9BACI|nr:MULTISPECIES: biotin--[acetyl-CoA-carboxylase] ligase [Bacillus]PLR80463.1 biotin--[acetyl-CoA-carboxylase] ligase [Bacillus canaveralius]PLR82672.1 biotin--[acetyl-CoA-carboxylase] ligase [Bacillus sp. V33-4]PLS00672.1 biotin--[acetyl-CoA-carboxylase] ligase [Bacillus canaveralius]RSK51914.1 biotin--[acetyl-CoA-carboxylase] ligase [Bacillus canaveralius]
MQSELRKQLLDAFTNAGGEYLSGQSLADLIGCSRTAVWKHIEELRKDGFELEAVRRKGYRIMKTPEKVSADEVRLGLKTAFAGQNIHYEETVQSTQKIAHSLAFDGAEEGTVILAEEQLSGRGRLDRKWYSPKYTGIWMSVILRPNILPSKAPQLTLLTAVAVVQAIEEMTGLSPQIKWPNDILINGRKVTGILTELQADADRIISIIIGIGINVNQQEQDYPEDIRTIATSLSIEKGDKLSRAALIRMVLTRLEKLYLLYLEKGFYPIKLLWEGYAISIGKEITARTLTGNISGRALGITDEGVLMIEDSAGKVHHIYSADIELAE